MNLLRMLFFPKYNEILIYIYTLIFLLLTIFDPLFKDLVFGETNMFFIVPVISVIAVSLFNAFVDRVKTDFEKMLILLFILFVNTYIANDIIKNEGCMTTYTYLTSIVPAGINWLQSFIMFFLYKYEFVSIKSIVDDEDITLRDAGFTLVLSIAVFLFLFFIYCASWSIVYSSGILIIKSLRNLVRTKNIFGME